MILKNNFLVSDAVQTLEFLVVATMTVLCCVTTFFSFLSLFTANVEQNTQVRRNYTTPHKTQMIDTTINLLVNRTECTNLSGTTLTLRLAVKSDNSSPSILFRDSEKLDATIKLSLTLPTQSSNGQSMKMLSTSRTDDTSTFPIPTTITTTMNTAQLTPDSTTVNSGN